MLLANRSDSFPRLGMTPEEEGLTTSFFITSIKFKASNSSKSLIAWLLLTLIVSVSIVFKKNW